MEEKPIDLINGKILPHLPDEENGSTVEVRKRYKCDECESTLTTAGNLKSHKLKFHGGEKQFKCSTCGYMAYTEYILKVHLKNHSEVYPYQCGICGYESKWSGHMKKHVFGHIKFKCDECGSTFNRESTLEKHKLTVHGDRFQCSTCGYLAFTESVLKKHLKEHAGNVLYKCNVCNYSSRHSGHILRHEIAHGKVKSDECDSTTKTSSLKKQKLTVDGKRFHCSTCGYLALTESRLKKHSIVHTGDSLYKCNICDYSSRHSGHIFRHQIAHGKLKALKCDECDSTLSTASTLKRHKLTVHDGGTRFDCSDCGYIPFNKSSLKRHLLVHTAEN